MKNASNPNHSAHIVVLSEVQKHPNADRLQKAKAFGAGIVVGLDAKDGDIGVYFQSGLAVDFDFATKNDLIRRKNPATGAAEGGMLETNGRIKTQKFRGESSDGLFLPLDSLTTGGVDSYTVAELVPGDFFNELNGVRICTKYVPKTRNEGGASGTKLPKAVGSIMFKEHYDTAQLRFNLDKINPEDYIVITEKVHGTSQRLGYVQKQIAVTGFKRFIAKLFGFPLHKLEWDDMVGTRRTVLRTDIESDTGFYSNDFRYEASLPFFDKLHKGETVYYEVVGYSGDKPVMGTVDNEKLGPEFVKQYGKKTTFTYRCPPGEFDIYVYRFTLTNEDGYTIDYTWDAIEKRAEELAVKHVPVLYKGPVSSKIGSDRKEDVASRLENVANNYVSGASTIDPNHIKEGVVIRIEGTSCPKTYKHKSFEFKVLEGIIKPETAATDTEEEL
jgi:hypothetical protein